MAKNKQAENAEAPKVTKCPVTTEEFDKHAQPLEITVGGKTIVAEVKRDKATGKVGFSTGSLGWYTNDKVTVVVNGKVCKAQTQIQIILVGSKPGEE